METCHILPLGPSSIGKTTLVCSVLDAMRTLFAGRKGGITIQIDNEARLDSCVRALRPAKGALPERLLEGTHDPVSFSVKAGSTAGLLGKVLGNKAALELVFHDYPGDLAEDLPAFTEKVMGLCDAEVLLVPVDATLFMEADTPQKEVAAQTLHKVAAIEELIVEWEKGRARTAGHGLIIFVPMRCEKYFADNGMQADPAHADRLSELVRTRFFSNIIDIITFFGQNINCLYVPVDTLGNCRLTACSWDTQNPVFKATYTMEGDPRPLGCEMIALFILDYCTRLARQRTPSRTLSEMEKTVDGFIDEFKEKGQYNRALRLC